MADRIYYKQSSSVHDDNLSQRSPDFRSVMEKIPYVSLIVVWKHVNNSFLTIKLNGTTDF